MILNYFGEFTFRSQIKTTGCSWVWLQVGDWVELGLGGFLFELVCKAVNCSYDLVHGQRKTLDVTLRQCEDFQIVL